MDQSTSTCIVIRWLNEDYDQWIKRITKELEKENKS